MTTAPSLGFSDAIIEGEWDAFEAGWDGTPWGSALWSFTKGTVFPATLSRAF